MTEEKPSGTLELTEDLGGWTGRWTHHPQTPGDGLFTDEGRTPRHTHDNPMLLICGLSFMASPLWLVLHDWGATTRITLSVILAWGLGSVLTYVVSQRSHAAARAARAQEMEVRVSGGMLQHGAESLPLASITHVVGGHDAITVFTDTDSLDLPNRGMLKNDEALLVTQIRSALVAAVESNEGSVPESLRQLVGAAAQSQKA